MSSLYFIARNILLILQYSILVPNFAPTSSVIDIYSIRSRGPVFFMFYTHIVFDQHYNLEIWGYRGRTVTSYTSVMTAYDVFSIYKVKYDNTVASSSSPLLTCFTMSLFTMFPYTMLNPPSENLI